MFISTVFDIERLMGCYLRAHLPRRGMAAPSGWAGGAEKKMVVCLLGHRRCPFGGSLVYSCPLWQSCPHVRAREQAQRLRTRRAFAVRRQLRSGQRQLSFDIEKSNQVQVLCTTKKGRLL